MTPDYVNNRLSRGSDKQGTGRNQINRALKTECERPSSDPE